MSYRIWVCNKCWRSGKADTQEEAVKSHDQLTPKCDYNPTLVEVD